MGNIVEQAIAEGDRDRAAVASAKQGPLGIFEFFLLQGNGSQKAFALTLEAVATGLIVALVFGQ
ncbi:MAG: hypothetical protein AAB955_03310 [Patescibacteria group bacterium]